jgi:hypothetical protein
VSALRARCAHGALTPVASQCVHSCVLYVGVILLLLLLLLLLLS